MAPSRSSWVVVKSLWWKNVLLKKRNRVSLLFEILLPIVCILLLSTLKSLDSNITIPAGWSSEEKNPSDRTQGTAQNLFSSINSNPYYVKPESTLSGLLLTMGEQSILHGIKLDELSAQDRQTCQQGVALYGATSNDPKSPYAMPKACAGKIAPYKLAIVPDNTFTRSYFVETLKKWYPRIELTNSISSDNKKSPVIPSLEDSVKFFASSKALDDYVSSGDYGRDQDHPRVFAGIVFDKFPGDSEIGQFTSMEYSLRLNVTADSVPRTIGDPAPYRGFARSVDTMISGTYTVKGFMTLQTLVTRFVNCMPEWDATTKTTSGKCQRPQSTAKLTDDMTQRLSAALKSDLMLKTAVRNFARGDISSEFESETNDAPSTADFLASISAEATEALMRPLLQAPQPLGQALVAPFPADSYVYSQFYEVVKTVFPMIFMVFYMLLVSKMLVSFINEKETRMREFMKIVGVKENLIILGWYLVYGAIILVIALLQALLAHLRLFKHSSLVLLFAFFLLFGLALMAYAYCMSALFSKARTGAFAGIVGFFLMYFVSAGIAEQASESLKTLACLMPPVALTYMVGFIGLYEGTGVGLTFSNMSTLTNNFRFITGLTMLGIDFVLYTLLGMYLERVVPKEFGTTLKWYYPFQPSHWYRNGRVKVSNDDFPILGGGASNLMTASLDVNPNVEPVGDDLREQERQQEILQICKLRKEFKVPDGTKVGVKHMNLKMYRNQITCLLGHNGAGKTTLISMLTGMTPATSGDAFFQGMSILDDMDDIRQSLGICFQHDALYPDLTVQEHLQFFARLKGYSKKELDEVVSKQIQEVGLTEKSAARSKTLSGGMKRKLSVAIALLGDSSLVFLDEPTSGMDPYSRRSTWEILLNNRIGRVMVLTTHFMDEADILGDRIAIMAEGELRCCGSSLFLKNRFGAGYNLTLVKTSPDDSDTDRRVINFIQSHVPNAQVLSNVGLEIAFQLPLDSSKQFARMFSELDNQLQQLGVSSYGVSVTTLEEVFIKVAELADDDNDTAQHTLQKMDNYGLSQNNTVVNVHGSNGINAPPMRSGFGSFGTQLKALLLKRFHYARRDRKMVIYTVGLPVLLLIVGFAFLFSSSLLKADPSMTINTGTSKLPGADNGVTPFLCQPISSDDTDGSGWCQSVMSKHFVGGKPDALKIVSPFYPTNTPTVFGLKYTDPVIEPNGTTGACLAVGEELFRRSFTNGVQNQFGAYIIYSSSSNNALGYNLYVNTTATHSAPIFKSLMDQALYRFFASQSVTGVTDPNALTLVVKSHPLVYTKATKAVYGSVLSLMTCLFIVIAFSYYPVAVIVFIVKEKEAAHNSKHQQLVSGVRLTAFWLANYLWDLLTYMVVAISAIVLIQLFNVQALTGKDCMTCTSSTFPAVILLFVLFGMAIIPFTYCLSFLFKEHAASQTYCVVLNFFLGLVLMILSFALSMFDPTKDISKTLTYIWRLSPLYDLGNGLLTLIFTEARASGDPTKHDPFSKQQILYELVYLAITAVVYSCLAVGIDYAMTFPNLRGSFGCFGSAKRRDQQDELMDQEMDEDVRKEAMRVTRGPTDDAIKLTKLRKVYPGGKIAVRDMSFGLQKGECFGFLGINGAGKTTTMKMLTGDEVPSAGGATLAGFDILTQQQQIRRLVGYCPQFDALFDLLSVREHLELFARIKGVPASQLNQTVQEKMTQLNLLDFENKLAGSLSGGNKRKLSVAIALIGDPEILFLDEPSTGMDPVSRRFMWTVISQISTQSKSSTVVLTTHSMEESEALCSRVGIMVGGRLRCLGSVQHLKSRFGDGFVFDVKLSPLSKQRIEQVVADHHLNDMITLSELQVCCQLLGDGSFACQINADHPTGHMLNAALRRDGYVRSDALCSWVLGEERFARVENFLKQSFGADHVVVLERQNDLSRIKLTSDRHGPLRISKVFGVVESMKKKLEIHEYSVCQTTLEQIFNSFASQQHEEQGVARGIVVN